MPPIIGNIHCQFIKRYLSNGKLEWGENIRQTFGMCKNGFLLPLELLIKVHPSITGDIKLVGLL
jgi:hypothetical protein